MKFLKTIFLTVITLVIFNKINAQDIVIGFQDSITSEVLEENRKILIRLPDDYNNSEKSYPVIYRLDGEVDLLVETVGIIYRLAIRE